ncbi:MAG TPA: ornithine cyclodeaminase family protein [Xanthobacteraceae bacterium]|jgi:alanine dehydrogenase|nr:ornithine cyclodeaminase family protein [Xanthobacteraceae bacterium]
MRPLYISENDVKALLDMNGAIDALDAMFRAQGDGRAKNSPRQRAEYWGGRLNIMSAGAQLGRFAFKAYAGTRAPTVYHVMLYDIEHGLLAIIEAQTLGRLRTGAATGLATDRLTPQTASTVGIIGSGRQARTQLQAVAAVRTLQCVQVFSRDAVRLAAFCETMTAELGIPVKPAASAEACVADVAIVITATTAATPVIRDAWLPRTVHINAMGANAASRMELEPASYARAGLIVTDDRDQARREAAEIIHAVAAGQKTWMDVKELNDLFASDGLRQTGGMTIFKSLGAALEDLAVASVIYDRAVETGRGHRLPA